MDPQDSSYVPDLAADGVREAVIDALYAHPEIGICAASLGGHLVHHDATFAALLGRAGQDLRGQLYDGILRPDPGAVVPEPIWPLDQSSVHRLTGDRRATRPDGTSVWLAATGHLTTTADGQHTYVVGVIRDITAERAARESAAPVSGFLRRASERPARWAEG